MISNELAEQTIKEAADNIRLREAMERDPDDIVIHSPTGADGPQPCIMCGLIADEKIETGRYLWHVCSRCIDILVSAIFDAKFMLAGSGGGFAYTQKKIQHILDTQLKGQ